jgi:hypothetical protein
MKHLSVLIHLLDILLFVAVETHTLAGANTLSAFEIVAGATLSAWEVPARLADTPPSL